MESTLGHEMIVELLKDVDANGDGVIDFQERLRVFGVSSAVRGPERGPKECPSLHLFMMDLKLGKERIEAV